MNDNGDKSETLQETVTAGHTIETVMKHFQEENGRFQRVIIVGIREDNGTDLLLGFCDEIQQQENTVSLQTKERSLLVAALEKAKFSLLANQDKPLF